MNKILVYCDSNEQIHHRGEVLRVAVEADRQRRFEWGGYKEIVCDVQFFLQLEPLYANAEKIWNVELKEIPDLFGSLRGHLYDQLVSASEIGHPVSVVVLGTDKEYDAFIDRQASRAFKDPDRLRDYRCIAQDFEANCDALNVRVYWWSVRWAERLLSHAHKLFTGGDLIAHRPKVRDDERYVAGLCMIADIGPVAARGLLAKYGSITNIGIVCLDIKNDDTSDLEYGVPDLGPIKARRVVRALKERTKSVHVNP